MRCQDYFFKILLGTTLKIMMMIAITTVMIKNLMSKTFMLMLQDLMLKMVVTIIVIMMVLVIKTLTSESFMVMMWDLTKMMIMIIVMMRI